MAFWGVVWCFARPAVVATAAAPQTGAILSAPASDPANLVKRTRKLSSEGQQDEALVLYGRALERAP